MWFRGKKSGNKSISTLLVLRFVKISKSFISIIVCSLTFFIGAVNGQNAQKSLSFNGIYGNNNPWGKTTGKKILTVIRNTSIVNGLGYSLLNKYGQTTSNILRIRVEDPSKTGYFFFGNNFFNKLVDEKRFEIQRYKQYSPSLSMSIWTLGFGGYAFSQLQDNISVNIEMGLSLIKSEIELNKKIIDNDYNGYWLSIGLNEKISKQVKVHIAMSCISPFSSDVINERFLETQINLITVLEFGCQIMLFNR